MSGKGMTKNDLLERALQILDAAESTGPGDHNLATYIMINGEVEKYLKAKNGKEPSKKQTKKLLQEIYKKLIDKPDVKIDVQWVQYTVFEDHSNDLPTGVDLMYYRLEKVDNLHKTFAEPEIENA